MTADWRQKYLRPRHRCVAAFCGNPAVFLNLACDFHRDILSDDQQAALEEWVRRDHPRGGGVTTVPEGLFAISRAGDGSVRRTWREQLEQDVDDGMFADAPKVIEYVNQRRRANR